LAGDRSLWILATSAVAGRTHVEIRIANLINMETGSFCLETMVGVADITTWNAFVFISLSRRGGGKVCLRSARGES
jgi:hypothetical protein